MEPKAHLGQSYNKQPDVDADNIGKDGRHCCGDVKVVCPLSSSGEHGTGRWHTRGGRVVGGDRRIPSYGGDYRYAREDKDVDVQLLLFESFGGFGRGVREILRKAANVLQNKLTRAQYLDEVTWTTKNWLGLQKQRISVVLHTAIAEQVVNELACGGGGRVHGAKCLATLAGVA
ncbi:hypothetical protein EMIHUDRAFT_241596 [Emiliania huxleyi CCMP1516]|uniref:Uncharacterized protein n=2 Tax=Emiliania huxleyi TaxID=2903 RepID=A0A0D3JC94_EMIH1|nr:hypothetical protein EMIHUDRAFT_241596 [Emiliania huxleyi CCMP1516]EOD21129.1 hypothetical protein EMIHUDRAFT_241596 [Emiliania huxleyi CCMP1516]|eukprot:XP_005773558.1 hypothetical protein EMIHUDRAFT_241596 [Emiliania huxleyi CCMP1516]